MKYIHYKLFYYENIIQLSKLWDDRWVLGMDGEQRGARTSLSLLKVNVILWMYRSYVLIVKNLFTNKSFQLLLFAFLKLNY